MVEDIIDVFKFFIILIELLSEEVNIFLLAVFLMFENLKKCYFVIIDNDSLIKKKLKFKFV